MDKWAHLGHTLGECWGDSNKNITFVHIPKNASSFIKGCLLSTEKFKHSNMLLNAEQYLVALRDPIERWVSGISQFMAVEGNKHLTESELVNTITFDDHTELQTYFLQNVDLNKCTFLRVDNNLRNNIKTWMAVNGYYVTNFDDMPNINQGDQTLKNKFATLIDNDNQIKLKLIKHYANDYELINRVKFYGN